MGLVKCVNIDGYTKKEKWTLELEGKDDFAKARANRQGKEEILMYDLKL